jgi:hypothetical protein
MNDNENPNGVPRPLPDATAKSQQEWREYCSQLIAEIEAFHTLVAELREEKRAYASMIPVSEETKRLAQMSPEELDAMSVPEEVVEELIRKLEQGEDV